MTLFPTDFSAITARVDELDVVAYGRTRNYVSGAVSRLSPYVSRGVVTLPFVRDQLLGRCSFSEAQPFIYELAWREYFQRVWWQQGDRIFDDLKQSQPVEHTACLRAVLEATTGIKALDSGIVDLYETGYLHNHLRMYLASVVCNIGRAHWLPSARWMYYHLLDGDLASNMLSWQWVAGTFSSKKYYANQENINTYTGTVQRGTFLDYSYELLPDLPIPRVLRATGLPQLEIQLPPGALTLNVTKPLLLYNGYQLDPQWRAGMEGNRVLLLEPSHFQRYPISQRVLSFILELAKNVPGLQVFTGEVHDIPGLSDFPAIFSKAHPAFRHYPGVKDEPEWMFPQAKPGNSFSAFWKSCTKTMNQPTV
ncbi:MAG: FAD-binding domain-containing protein [Cyclobacteriaceae bacterium]|jgi:deoxyribodipyrimidine photo-lyase